MHASLASSLTRLFLASRPGDRRSLSLEAARGERVAFQIAVRAEEKPLTVAAGVQAPDGLSVRVRRVGYVPLPHLTNGTPREELEGSDCLPGFVPDPLFPEATLSTGPWETHAFWCTVEVPSALAPGQYSLTVSIRSDDSPDALRDWGLYPRSRKGDEERLDVMLTVHPLSVSSRLDFPVTHWFWANALCDYYQTALWEDRFWALLPAYLANLTAHGQDTILVPLFSMPQDAVRRPTQLLGVVRAGDRYCFDWTLVERWVRVAQQNGLRRFEWPHLFSPTGVAHPATFYEGHGEAGVVLWPDETGATSATYQDFLKQFLPAFERFLQEQGIMEQSFFHLSDEPQGGHLPQYRTVRELLWKLAPWMRVMDALSEPVYVQEGLIDHPVALINEASRFVDAGYPAWVYFACMPRGRHLNRFLDTPLATVRMSGWLLYRLQARGFLHWGYNFWYPCGGTSLIDPFAVSDARLWPKWPHGDPFVVYPGPNGPLDSLRWEVFSESLQDYALLQSAGIAPDDPLLADIHTYAEFPRSAAWIAQARQAVLRRSTTIPDAVAP